MTAGDFNPKLGRIRSTPGRKSQRYLNRVIQNMRKASQGRSGIVGTQLGVRLPCAPQAAAVRRGQAQDGL